MCQGGEGQLMCRGILPLLLLSPARMASISHLAGRVHWKTSRRAHTHTHTHAHTRADTHTHTCTHTHMHVVMVLEDQHATMLLGKRDCLPSLVRGIGNGVLGRRACQEHMRAHKQGTRHDMQQKATKVVDVASISSPTCRCRCLCCHCC